MRNRNRGSSTIGVVLKFTVALTIGAILACTGYMSYRNIYLKGYTEKSLDTISSYASGGKIKDYRNVLGVESIDDITYEHDEFLRLYKVYFGNYAVYLTEEESSWSPEALQEELGYIGITFERDEDFIVFSFGGQELKTPDWRK